MQYIDQPDIEQSHSQDQARQAQEVLEVGTFKIKAMFFHVTEHFLNPHSPAIGLQSQLAGGEIGGQQTWLFLTPAQWNEPAN